jgi:hypothetical protein
MAYVSRFVVRYVNLLVEQQDREMPLLLVVYELTI